MRLSPRLHNKLTGVAVKSSLLASILWASSALSISGCQVAHPMASDALASQTPNVGLYTQTFGKVSDPAVVFVHGGPGYNSFSFEASTAESLSQLGFYVVVYDERGAGRSPNGVSADFTYSKYIKDLDEVIHSTGAVRPVLLGHSFGGSLALKYFDKHRTATRGVILADAPLSYPSTLRTMLAHCKTKALASSDADFLATVQALQAQMFPSSGGYGFTADNVGTVFGIGMVKCGLYTAQHPSPTAAAIQQALAADPRAFLLSDLTAAPFAGFIANEHYEASELLPLAQALRSKVFAIIGSEDGLFDSAMIGAVQTALGTTHVAVIPGASHSAFIDQPEIFRNNLQVALAALLHAE